jgi:hypothetical protein
LINNRQNGRRRGRGGTRPPNGTNSGPERGNRLDNRARGNANQLHEKYKTLARDAQMQGDRVMTEYYLQFADHYFRVLSESRSRFEEQRPRSSRDDQQEYDDEDGDGEMNAAYDDRGDYRDDGGQEYRQQAPRQNEARQNDGRQNDGRQDGRQNDRQGQNERQNDGRQSEARGDARPNSQNDGRQDGRRERGNDRPDRGDQRRREPRPERAPEARQAEQRPQEQEHERQVEVRPADPVVAELPLGEPQAVEAQAPAPVTEAAAERPRRTRVRRETPPVEAAERIEIDRLPPSFSPPAEPVSSDAAPAAEGDGEEAPRRRRTRRPRTDVAPAEL